MITTNEGYMRLEYFSENVAADRNRKEFDIKNHILCYTNQKPDFLFIGDSITEYWELNAYFRKDNQLIVNRGIAGDTTEYLKKRFYVDAVQLRPKYCILGIGINDSIELEGDYWKKLKPAPYNEILETAKTNIIEIIQQAKEEKISLILTSLLPISIPILTHERSRKKYIKEMNNWLSEMAERNNLIFVNYYATMTFPGTDKLLERTTYDGLHPNAKGYQIMATVLRNTLKENKILI
ncbi:GDSL-type esterase/lipase family protein [Blautia obeum]|uniref:GDSL-type esterase/lipase family protein n=2 Tax=Lachnospiraceae TaxID=186803 RepID=UPI003CFBF14A